MGSAFKDIPSPISGREDEEERKRRRKSYQRTLGESKDSNQIDLRLQEKGLEDLTKEEKIEETI